ncbi:MAG TPA: hypothetical protein VGS97_09540, partial [Actinocrinis sp.]|nr:hypothetical protein [Actinocrinis sp.]
AVCASDADWRLRTGTPCFRFAQGFGLGVPELNEGNQAAWPRLVRARRRRRRFQELVSGADELFEVVDARVCAEFLDRKDPCGPLCALMCRHPFIVIRMIWARLAATLQVNGHSQREVSEMFDSGQQSPMAAEAREPP